MAARLLHCQPCSLKIHAKERATSGCIACKSTTGKRPVCTGISTKLERDIINTKKRKGKNGACSLPGRRSSADLCCHGAACRSDRRDSFHRVFAQERIGAGHSK